MGNVLIGLDLGTTLCKSAVYDLEGKQLFSAVYPIPTDRASFNAAEQWPEDWTHGIIQVLKEAANHIHAVGDTPIAIGVSAHGPGAIFLDKDDKLLCPVAIWQDNRCAEEGYRLFQEIGYDWVGHGIPQTGFAARLRWAQKNWPHIKGKIFHVHDVKGYLLHVLTGAYVTEPSSSAGALAWDEKTLKACGLDMEQMDVVQPSSSIAGGLCETVAIATGLQAGIPVVCGLNDGAAAVFGAGAIDIGSGVVSVSTNGIARVVLENKLPGEMLYETSMFCWPYVDGKYVAGGFTKGAGDTVQWFLDIAYRECDQEEGLRLFNLEAEQSGIGAKALAFYPWLLGRGSPDATEQPAGCFMGMGRHHQRGDFARAIFEGIAYALRDVGVVFRNMGYSWDRVALTGGGMKSALWRSIVCDVLDVNGSIAQADSLLGAAMMAGIGVGVYQNGKDAIKKCVTCNQGNIRRDPRATAYYQKAYQRYCSGKSALAEYNRQIERENK